MDRPAWLATARHEDEEPLASLRQHARDLDLAIAMSYLRKTDAAPENSCVLIDRHGRKVLAYSKVHTCPFEVEKYCQPGNSFPVADLDTRAGGVRVGIMICFDREFPESARILTLNGAELILVPNACVVEEHRISQLRTRAFDNEVALAMVNYPEPRFNGQSTGIDAVFFDEQGRSLDPVVAAGGSAEEIVLATFDVDPIRRYRAGAIWGNAYRRPEIYNVLTDAHSSGPSATFEPKINGNIRAPLERVRHRQNQKGDSQGSQKVIQAMSWVKGGQPWMTRPYSEDLRERVVRVVESGTSRNAAAKQFDVSISFVVKLMQRWKQRGTIKADKYGGWKKSKLAPHGDRIRALVMENCDITIDELCVLLAAEGIEAKRSTLGDFLLAQGLSRKKRQPTPPSRSALTSRRREPLGATSNLG